MLFNDSITLIIIDLCTVDGSYKFILSAMKQREPIFKWTYKGDWVTSFECKEWPNIYDCYLATVYMYIRWNKFITSFCLFIKPIRNPPLCNALQRGCNWLWLHPSLCVTPGIVTKPLWTSSYNKLGIHVYIPWSKDESYWFLRSRLKWLNM